MRRGAMIVAGATVIALLIPAVRHFRESPPPPPPAVRLSLSAPTGTELGAGDEPLDAAISPDQRQIVFVATERHREAFVQPPAGATQLWRQRLDAERAEVLAGTANARQPAWKQTGNVVSFFADGRLKLLQIDTGTIHDVAEAPMPAGATWLRDGSLLFVPGPGPIRRVINGRVSDATRLAAGDSAHVFPVANAASQDFVYVAVRDDGRRVVRLNAGGAESELGTTSAHAALTGPGGEWLVFVKDGTLLADRRAPDGPGLTGRDTVLGLEAGVTRLGRGLFSVASDVLLYARAAERQRRITWVDLQGAQVGTVADAGDYWQVRLAPDDSRVAVTARDPQLRSLDVLMVAADNAAPSLRLSTSIAADTDPVWSQDARQVAFRSMQRGRPEILAVRAAAAPEGSSETARRLEIDGDVPTDWRGPTLLVQRRGTAGFDLVRVNETTGMTTPIAATSFNETDARWSPDGQWVAYVSDESGRPDIYVTTDRQERHRVSLGGGTHPRWTRDGRALLFLRGSMLMRAVRSGGRFEPPQPMFELPGVRDFDTAHRTARIVALLPAQADPVDAVSAVLNWRSLVPVTGR